VSVARPVVDTAHRRSAVLAADYYRALRTVQLGEAGGFAPVLAEPLTDGASATLVATGPAATKAATARGLLVMEAAEYGFTRLAGAAQRLALDGGRSTIGYSIDADPQAIGYARATSARPCSFCAMLASRGPVYTSEATASFRAHGACHCTPKPVFTEDDPWPDGSRRFADLWNRSAKGEPDAENAFRRAYEADPELRDARNARRRELYRQRRDAAADTTA
jgi:hypothetical protein